MITVVELDLVDYTHIAYLLQESIGVDAVNELNKQIQNYIDQGLKAVEISRAQAVKQITGDGAILVFEKPQHAHQFAAATHHLTQKHNSLKRKADAQQWAL